ncbi:hypothetical protein [Kibdelosporangium philippinense]
MVNTVCRKGGHTLPERWTRCSGTVDTAVGGENQYVDGLVDRYKSSS